MKYGGNFTVSYVGSTFRVSYLIINEFFLFIYLFFMCAYRKIFFI